ncbi:unnamed protein product, partial [Didymodactylos carnosus]
GGWGACFELGRVLTHVKSSKLCYVLIG